MANGTSGIPKGTAGPGITGPTNWSQAPNTPPPESLKEALGEKGRPLSIGNAVMGANPYFDPTFTYAEFNQNCNRCVVAYEARRRGYDVVAQPTYEGDDFGNRVYAPDGTVNARWQGAFQGAKTDMVGGQSANDVITNINGKMKEWGNGSRAVVGVDWKGGGGHVFNVERQSGRSYFVDAQSGEIYDPKQVFAQVNPQSVRLVRTDNLRFSNRAMRAVEQDTRRG